MTKFTVKQLATVLGFETSTETYGLVRVMLNKGMLVKVGQVEREKLPSGKGAPGKRQDLFSITDNAIASFEAMLAAISAANTPETVATPVATVPVTENVDPEIPAIAA